ncbi:hypothetical protein Q7C36_023084 [Tachysurus vachellii]|uniref:Uncharacterized protein n=1 Tax=Tachysurus vachellii TaxID=175792 RepID=A0AA88IJ78_TACVA|nr:hypothetical protein Q7C36_023084 [Tachysurus vachellii]
MIPRARVPREFPGVLFHFQDGPICASALVVHVGKAGRSQRHCATPPASNSLCALDPTAFPRFPRQEADSVAELGEVRAGSGGGSRHPNEERSGGVC